MHEFFIQRCNCLDFDEYCLSVKFCSLFRDMNLYKNTSFWSPEARRLNSRLKNCKNDFADNAWLWYRISFNRNHSFYKIVDFQVLKSATESKKKNATANKLNIFIQWMILCHWVLSIYTNKISSRGQLYMFGWTSIRGGPLLENCFCWRKYVTYYHK